MKKYNILYVDDEVSNLRIFKNTFRREFNVFTANSAQEGMKIMDCTPIHLVLSDQRMPEMTGVEFLKYSLERHPEPNRILITGYTDLDAIENAINKAKIYQYIQKPWDKNKLQKIIENALYIYQIEHLSKKQSEELLIAKEKAEASEKRLKEAQKIAHLGHWELDLIKNKLKWSDEVFRIFGMEPQEFMATYEAFLENIHPEDRDKINEAYKKSLETRQPYKIEHRLLLNSGDIKYVLERCKTDYDNSGNPIRSIGTVLDITQLKKIELELEKQNTEYATLNKEYRATNEKLLIAKEKAEESIRLKTEFLRNISHEIRTPLNGILGFSNILGRSDIFDEKNKEYIDVIQKSGKQLLRIIDDILEMSMLEAKQIKTEDNEVCLNKCLLELFSIFKLAAEEKRLELLVKEGLPNEESTIIADEKTLNNVLSKLLINAIKFTNQGHIEVGYRLITENTSPQLQIFVNDTGIGIKKESLKTIFLRFSQEEKDISRNVGGLGLGLSIAQENAKLLGGSITVESEKEKGSSFILTIPYTPVTSKKSY